MKSSFVRSGIVVCSLAIMAACSSQKSSGIKQSRSKSTPVPPRTTNYDSTGTTPAPKLAPTPVPNVRPEPLPSPMPPNPPM